MDGVIDISKLENPVKTLKMGETLFLEGDDSQDLYVLIEGTAGILKGTRLISEISEQGAIFGEMAFLLGEDRTATVKALTDLKVVKIRTEEIPAFLSQFPQAVRQFARHLAQRLDEASRIIYGLKEFCDRLPDAVILTDKDGKVLSWNRAAEALYGRSENQMRHRPAAEVYEDPAEHQQLLKEVKSKGAADEKILRVRHPQHGIRHIATRTTVLYDGQHNLEGILFLGRDVTQAEMVAKRYRRAKRFLIPLSAVLIVLAAVAFWGYPYYTKGSHLEDVRKQELREGLAFHYRLLRSLLAEPFGERNRLNTTEVLKTYFDAQKGGHLPFIGVALLDRDKRIFDAYSPLPGFDATSLLGSSYASIDLGEREEAPYRVLVLYRKDKDHPMGMRHTEIAFRVTQGGRFQGWLLLHLDIDFLKEKYNAGVEDIRAFRFEEL